MSDALPQKPLITPVPANETERLAALHRYKILDTPPEAAFDRLTTLAARLFAVPTVLISLVDASRAWFKSGLGFDAREVPRDTTLCSFAVLTDEPLIVPDAQLDERFACNPFVQSEPGIRFYAGAPLLSRDGFNLGTLCLLDSQPRDALSAEQQATLVDLAAMVVDELELRLAAHQIAQVDTALRESEARSQLALQIAQLGTWRYVIEPNRVELDARMREIWGEPEDAEVLPLSQVMARIHPEDLAQVTSALGAALDPTSSGAYAVDYRIVWNDGTVRWLSANGQTTFAGDGALRQALESFGTAVDITDRKRVEVALRKSEERSQSILESITDGFFALDQDWRFTYVNPQAERLLDRTSGELLDRVLWEVYPGTVGTEFERAYRQTASERVAASFISFYPDHNRWYEVYAYPATDGITVYFRDVTDRKQAEATLRESEERFRTLADNMAQFAWMADENGWIFWYNQRWFDYTGTTLEEMQGWGWQKVHHPEHVDRVVEHFRQCLETGETWEDTFPLRGTDGQYRWFLSRALPIRNEQGRVVRWFGTNTDITERKQIEETLRQRETELRLVTDAVPALIAFVDSDQRYRFNSRGYEAWFGQPATEIYGKSVREVLGEVIYEGLRPYIEQVLTGQQVTFESQVPYREGGTRYVSVIYVPRFDAQGAVEGFVALVNDISDRKRVEQALRENEEQSRNILESISDAFLALDQNWRFTYMNQTAETLLGYASGSVTGKVFWEEFPGLEGSELAQLHRRVMRDRVAESLTAFYPDHDRWYEVRSYPATDGITIYFTDVTEQIQAAAALRQSEARYRTLFESIDEGFCVVEVLLDADDTPINYRYLEINPAFEQQTGIKNALGRTVRELIPGVEPFWFDIYGMVALTGEPKRSTDYSQAMDQWFDLYAFRIGEPHEHKVAVLFNDVTSRKQTEEILRRAAELDAFRVSLADALRPLADPVEVQATASRLLGEYLKANRVAYFEVRGGDYVVERDYVNGAVVLAGGYSIASFGSKLLAEYRAGRTVCMPNVSKDPYLSPAQRSAYATIQIGAYIGIPLVKDSEFVAGLAVHAAEPRAWTEDEVALAEEVAERTWAAVDRARAEAIVAADLQDTKLLRELGARLVSEGDIQTLYQAILSTAIALTQADAGTVQSLDVATHELVLLTTQGFERTLTALSIG
jgi:PAS domain S-box-containing protein